MVSAGEWRASFSLEFDQGVLPSANTKCSHLSIKVQFLFPQLFENNKINKNVSQIPLILNDGLTLVALNSFSSFALPSNPIHNTHERHFLLSKVIKTLL